MGYAIQYGSKPRCEKNGRKNRIGANAALIALILVAVMCVRAAFPGLAQRVRGILLPGFGNESAAAFAAMVERVGEGERVDHAVGAFCQEIMENAQIQYSP